MKLLRLLIRLYPVDFRARFGAEIEEQIARDHERARRRGPGHATAFAVATVLDLGRSALAERWNPTWVDERARVGAEGGESMMGEWIRNLRYAVASLARARGFTVVTVCTLGLAIGANAGIFSVVDTVMLDPLPFANADRLVQIALSAPGSDLPDEFGPSSEFYLQFKEESRLLEDVAVVNSFTATLRADDRVERVRMSTPTSSLFTTLGGTPILGRLPVPEDEGQVAVISHALWTTWFGSDPSVIGRTYETSFGPRTVIAVMPPEFRFPTDDVLIWIPDEVALEGIQVGRFGNGLIGRMAPDVTREALATELTTLARRLPERFGGSANYARIIEQIRPIIRPIDEMMLGSVSGALWVLLGSVAIVLLVACANVANLFLVRAERRGRDAAVRRALGATVGQLVRAQMAEAVVIAAAAACLAGLLAWVSVPAFVRAAPAGIPRIGDVRLTLATFLFTLAVAAFAAIACGLFPALRFAASGMTRLRDGARGSTRRGHWARDGLVVAQTSLALVLLIGSGLLVRSFRELRSVDPGYDVDDIFTFQMAPEADDLRDGPSFARFHLDFVDRLRALPGVESVGIVENLPLNEGVSSMRILTEATATEDDGGTLLGLTFTGADYFPTMGIDLVEGRAFADRDHLGGELNAVVSRSAADLLWPGEDALGRRLHPRGSDDWATVVGVVADVMQSDFRTAPQPLVYLPLAGPSPTSWTLSSPAYVVKTARAETIAPEVRALVREVAASAPMYRVFTMAGLARDSMVSLSFMMLTLGIASALALVLGAVGLYGILSYVVAERTREIGVRMALGAEARRVQRMVVAQGARVVVVGVVIGLGVAFAATRALASLLYGVAAADPATFVLMSAAMLMVGLLATYLPARRASGVDPILSLRGE